MCEYDRFKSWSPGNFSVIKQINYDEKKHDYRLVLCEKKIDRRFVKKFLRQIPISLGHTVYIVFQIASVASLSFLFPHRETP